MRAYVRRSHKRWARAEDAAHREAAPPPSTNASPAAAWLRFGDAVASGLESFADPGQRRRLDRFVRCVNHEFGRVYGCGAEDAALGAWCGHPYCPSCAEERAEAATEAALGWDPRVLEVRIPIGRPDGLELPSEASVASLRAAWGRATALVAERTGFARLEAVPRTVVTPDGIMMWARLPWGDRLPERSHGAERCLADEVAAACRRAGFRAHVRATSREEAAREVRAAVTAESTRLGAEVARDLGRIGEHAWRRAFPRDASVEAALRAIARRWIAWLDGRARTRRRGVVFGSSGSLPLPGPGRPTLTPERCPSHGRGCRAVATVIRDRARGHRHEHDDLRAPAATTTQALQAFFTGAIRDVAPVIALPARRRIRRAG